MSKKRCVYEGCKNISTNSTLFQFPRNPIRYREWIKLSGCDNLKENDTKYLCERHFSPIYVTASQRRKMLLNSAVPYNFKENETYDTISPKRKTSFSAHNDYKDIKNEIEEDEYLLVEIADEDKNTIEDSKEESDDPSVEGEHLEDRQTKLLKTESSVNSKTTTFIFNGEKYIQMPMETYLNEKNNFLSEIETYKSVLKKFKKELELIELN